MSEAKTNLTISLLVIVAAISVAAAILITRPAAPRFYLVMYQLQDLDSTCQNPKCINQYTKWVQCNSLTEWYRDEMKKQNAIGKSCVLVSAWPVTESEFKKAGL